MLRNNSREEIKKIVAKEALNYIYEGLTIGVGSGSTVKFFIEFLAKENIEDVTCIPTSYDTELILHQKGLKVSSLSDVDAIDIAVDGADSVLLNKKLIIKGGGGALLREKIVDYSAKMLLIIVDYTKLDRPYPIPTEILPFAYSGSLIRKLKQFGEPKLRYGKNKLGPVITDNGNWIIDIYIDDTSINGDMERKINLIPGVLENGIFTKNARILIGHNDGTIEEEKI